MSNRATLDFFRIPRFPGVGLSTSNVRADWLHDWSSAARWAQLLITYIVAYWATLDAN